MELELTDEERAALLRLARRQRRPLCPQCGYRESDSRLKSGLCRECTDVHERVLESKRRWWRENRGKAAP